MSRKIIEASPFPFHITARTVNREPFPLRVEQLWRIFGDYLYFAHAAHGVKIQAFVLMPNHFHLLARFPEKNMGAAMGYFMGETSRQIGKCSGRINQTFGRRYHRSVISNATYLTLAYKYLYRNPVKAGLCEKVEEYPYSSLHGILGRSRLEFPIEEDVHIFTPTFREETVNWLNRSPHPNHEHDVRLALRRQLFQLPRDKNSKRPNELEAHEF